MPNLNENYLKLQENYLFSEIAHRVAAYTKQHPEKNVIRLGIGDVTRPLCQCAGEALLEGAKEMMSADTFKGYGPEQGYEDIRKAIQEDRLLDFKEEFLNSYGRDVYERAF